MGLRIMSAIVGIPVLLFFILQGGFLFALMVFALASVGLWEYSKMVIAKGYQIKPVPLLCSAWVMIVSCYFRFADWASMGLMTMFLIIFIIAVIQFPGFKVSDIAVNFLGLIYVGWTMTHLLLLGQMEHGVLLVLYLFVAIWSSDSGAYFVGRFLGRHKLCPEVSPKKTIEGAIGGIATTCLILFLLNLYCNLLPDYGIALIGIVISIVGQLGDLIESLIKRFCNVKDSGNLIPGHGGILDRFDSIMLAAPFMYYCLRIVQYLG